VTITRDDAPALAFAALLFGLAALLPLTGSAYWMGIGISIAMFTVLSTSWALFSGPTHYISLATAAFFGLGTYTVGLGFETLPFWSLILIAGGHRRGTRRDCRPRHAAPVGGLFRDLHARPRRTRPAGHDMGAEHDRAARASTC
jgi:hypothetical protein